MDEPRFRHAFSGSDYRPFDGVDPSITVAQWREMPCQCAVATPDLQRRPIVAPGQCLARGAELGLFIGAGREMPRVVGVRIEHFQMVED